MRFALFLALLFPALAGAQDIPSLQRSYVTQPIVADLPALRARLGGPGGAFAAAQIALKGPEGLRTLIQARTATDPLVRLDAAYGLGFFDTEAAYEALAELIGDPDPRVAGEADHGLRLAGKNATHALQAAAFSGTDAAGDAAVWLLVRLGPPPSDLLPDIAKTESAAGRRAAIELFYNLDLKSLADATNDRRPAVREAALRRLVFAKKTPERMEAIRRVSQSKDESRRHSLVQVISEYNYEANFTEAIVAFANDPSPAIRAQVARALPTQPNMGRKPTPAQERLLVRAIVRLASDRVPAVSDSMIDNLDLATEQWLNNGPQPGVAFDTRPESVDRLRNSLAKRLSGPSKEKAALVLAVLHDRRALPVLAQKVDAQPAGAISEIVALGVLGDRRATPHLLLAATTGLDRYAYTALGQIKDPRAVAPLVKKMLAHPDQEAYGAAPALAKIGDRRAAKPMMKLATRDVDPNLRAPYYGPLGELGGPGVLEWLVDRLEHGTALETVCAADGLVALRDPRALDAARQIVALPDAHRAKEAQRVIDALEKVEVKA